MKITKRQLRRIIREEKTRLLSERGTGIPALAAEEQAVRIAVVKFADKYILNMGMNVGDPNDLQRVRDQVDNMVDAVMGVL